MTGGTEDLFPQHDGRWWWQYAAVIATVGALTGLYLALLPYIGYRVVGFLYILAVLFLALWQGWERGPLLLAATLSALLWNFLFIPPRFTFAIHHAEDVMMFAVYFVTASVVGTLNARMRNQEQVARRNLMLMESDRLYRTLLSSISHELRTPITAIGNALSHLRHPQLGRDEAMRADLLNEIEEANERLNRVVQNLLDMARLESGRMPLHLQPTALGDLVEVALRRAAGDLQGRPVAVAIDPDLPLVEADFGLMDQVLTNLLRNCVAYTPPGTPIDVAVRARDGQVAIEVADQGPGLQPEVLARVFDKFYRAPHASPGGTGLGLSICRGLVEAHRGTIRAESPPGGGLRVIVTLPASPHKGATRAKAS